VKTTRPPAGTASRPRRIGGLAVGVLALALGLLSAQEPETRYAWNESEFELAITIAGGDDHEFQFCRLGADNHSVVFQAVARGRATGKLVFQESERADGAKPVRIEFQIGKKEIVVSTPPTTLLDGSRLDLSGTYRFVTAEVRLAHAKTTHIEADRQINEFYQGLKGRLGKEDAARLRAEQLRWIDHRNQMAAWTARTQGAGEAPESCVDYWRVMADSTRGRLKFVAVWDGANAAPGPDGTYNDGFGGTLTVSDSNAKTMRFAFEVVRGPTAHTGELEGTARRNGNQATFTDADLPVDQRRAEPCVIRFVFIGNRVEVATENTEAYHGARAYFHGAYYKTPAAVGEPGLAAPPDGPAGLPLEHLDHMAAALQGYRGLTEWIRKNHAVPDAVLKKHAASDWESQNLGFRNWPVTLRETLLRQEAELADLRLRVAAADGSPPERIQALGTESTRTRSALDAFLKTKTPAAD
jgi:uncharacterized protein YecT (DUF1311 family)